MTDQATPAVLAALQTLYNDPDAGSKKRANEWLEEFQHSVEAWQTCHTLLTSPDAPPEGRLFSAQTIRAKILYDLPQLPRQQLPPLRDSLLTSLPPLIAPGAPSGSKAVLVQLCLALADLALQMPEWDGVVQGMIERFGQDPSTVTILLRFLKALVEEVQNSRLTVVGDIVMVMAGMTTWCKADDQDQDSIISSAAEPVIGVLSMYIQAPGIPTSLQSIVFDTLRSWLQGGEVAASQVCSTPLFPALFDALPNDELFDSAVDCLCDLIHETQEVQENIEVIHQVLPRLLAIVPELERHTDDEDRIRGYCRILSEAGETYKDLIVHHPTEFLPLVQGIAQCAAYPDLDIVPITFGFWYVLASALGHFPEDPALRPILDIFEKLQTVIINHLHFPADDDTVSAAERDEFRMFRHRMGDTLKDCCHVLGAPACLRRSYEMIQDALAKPPGSVQWQEIEAPLFSMRSMGAEVDPNDDEVLPHIMDMLPALPDHPKIRYAAILVISRYTQWIDRHPQNLAFQLQYISAGFEMANEDVSAAAAQAMKFMCQDCKQHLVPFLPQLHAFFSSVGDKLDQSDMVEVCEAIGYVLKVMPADQTAAALQQFTEPLIQRIQAVATAPTVADKPELEKVADAMELIDSFLAVIGKLDPLPASCMSTPAHVWAILDALLSRHAHLYFISERIGSLVRRGLQFFPLEALQSFIIPLVDRMGGAFAATGYPSYMWVQGRIMVKCAEATRGQGGVELAAALIRGLEGLTAEVGRMLGEKVAREIPDVMDDYVYVFRSFLTSLPEQTLHSPCLSTAVSHVLSALTCSGFGTIMTCLETLSYLCDLLHSDPAAHSAQTYGQNVPDVMGASHIIQPIFAQYGKGIAMILIEGAVRDFPEDSLEQAQIILLTVTRCAPPAEVEGWMGEAMEGLRGNVVGQADKANFLRELHDHLEQPGGDRIRSALLGLVRAARKMRERGRQSRQSLGGR